MNNNPISNLEQQRSAISDFYDQAYKDGLAGYPMDTRTFAAGKKIAIEKYLENQAEPVEKWIEIKSVEDLPKDRIECWFVHNETVLKGYYDITFLSLTGSFGWGTVTHYQPITKPKLPTLKPIKNGK